MPRRSQVGDADFDIHVDPSCVSGTSDFKSDMETLVDYTNSQLQEWKGNGDLLGKSEDAPRTVTNNSSQETVLLKKADDGGEHEELASVQDSATDDGESVNTNGTVSRRESAMSAVSRPEVRRTSTRTEALIHSAARDIIAQIGNGRGHERDSLQSASVTEDDSYVYSSRRTSTRLSRRQSSETGNDDHHDHDHSINEEEPVVDNQDEAGDSSSHHENEDDVFSDHSPRSSIGSMSDAEKKKMDDDMSQRTRSPRISNISQYEVEEEFIPTVRGTPRPPFRSPSSVRAIQMSSPPPSVLGSPRSSRRSPLPTVSRLGSPSFSAQYSPKKTPPRFKRNTPPLVLLHATVLPLRWPMGDVLENAQPEELSSAGKALREAWRQLQDQVGDTVLERGILLPHPQNDYEVLEERLLEALELPMKRRARILECGHYLGPANEMDMANDVDSENDDYYDGARSPSSNLGGTGWCSTCGSDIKFEPLGPGKIFRVKVYASNGLMKAGAWEACWKEMERVDVELEPIVEPAVQEELDRLAAEQDAAMGLGDDDHDDVNVEHLGPEDELETSYLRQSHSHSQSQPRILPSSPPPGVSIHRGSGYDDRRRRDEERLREIYGHTPPTRPEMSTAAPSPSDFIPKETPPSPSVEAFERRQERRHAYKSASLPELLLEAAKILLRDRRNVVIGVLSLLIMTLAVGRGAPPPQDAAVFQPIVNGQEVPTVTVTQTQENVNAASTMGMDNELDVSSVYGSMEQKTVTPERMMPVVETITETATVKVTEVETYAEAETDPASLPPAWSSADEDLAEGAVSVEEEAIESKGAASPEEIPFADEVVYGGDEEGMVVKEGDDDGFMVDV